MEMNIINPDSSIVFTYAHAVIVMNMTNTYVIVP